MNKTETEFKNYGEAPHRDFFVEVNDEADRLGIRTLPLGASANRFNKYWNIYIETFENIDTEKLKQFLVINPYIKLYNKNINELDFNFIYKNYKDNVYFSVYTEESLTALINFIKHYDVSIKTFASGYIAGMQACKSKSDILLAKRVEKPCAIISDGKRVLCDTNSYILLDKFGKLSNMNKEEFNSVYELY